MLFKIGTGLLCKLSMVWTTGFKRALCSSFYERWNFVLRKERQKSLLPNAESFLQKSFFSVLSLRQMNVHSTSCISVFSPVVYVSLPFSVASFVAKS